MKTIDLNSKTGLVLIGGAFVGGTVFGWYLKTWRLQWLAKKRDFFSRKAMQAQEQIDGNVNSDSTSATVIIS